MPRFPSLFIIGRCCSVPQTAAWLISRLCPLNLVCYHSRPMMVLVLTLPFSPLPRFTRVTCPLQFARFLSLFTFASSPSLSFGRPSPPAASGHPSSVRRTPPADSSGGLLLRTFDQCPLLDSTLLYVGLFPDLCGWWYLALVWVEGRRRRRPSR